MILSAHRTKSSTNFWGIPSYRLGRADIKSLHTKRLVFLLLTMVNGQGSKSFKARYNQAICHVACYSRSAWFHTSQINRWNRQMFFSNCAWLSWVGIKYCAKNAPERSKIVLIFVGDNFNLVIFWLCVFWRPFDNPLWHDFLRLSKSSLKTAKPLPWWSWFYSPIILGSSYKLNLVAIALRIDVGAAMEWLDHS